MKVDANKNQLIEFQLKKCENHFILKVITNLKIMLFIYFAIER